MRSALVGAAGDCAGSKNEGAAVRAPCVVIQLARPRRLGQRGDQKIALTKRLEDEAGSNRRGRFRLSSGLLDQECAWFSWLRAIVNKTIESSMARRSWWVPGDEQ